jgi:hypothetical protein
VAAARTFDGVSFGPMHVRRVLRERLQPGERVIGWGSGFSGTFQQGLSLGLIGALLPGAGTAVAAAIAARLRRIVILTDRRLLVLRTPNVPGEGGGRGGRRERGGERARGRGQAAPPEIVVAHDWPLSMLTIESASADGCRFAFTPDPPAGASARGSAAAGPALTVRFGKVKPDRTPPMASDRLVEGLRVLGGQ